MDRIFKYDIPYSREYFKLSLPKDAQIISVGEQYNRGVLYARLNPEHEKEDRHFTVLMTGQIIDPAYDGTFLGTLMFDGGTYVLHIYEDK